MENQRNLILAVVLSLALFLGWEFVSDRYFPQPVETSAPVSATTALPSAAPGTDAPAPVRNLATEIARPDRIRIDAPEITGSINPVGARIDDIDLKTHRQTVEQDSGPIRLFAPDGTSGQQFAQFGWTGTGVKLPDPRTPWQVVEGERLTQETPLVLGWDNGAGLQFRLRYEIDEHYMVTVEQTVANTGATPIALTPYAFINRTNANADPSTFNVHSGPISAIDGSVQFSQDYDDVVESGTVENTARTDWVGFTDIYWMSALIPDTAHPANSAFRSLGGDLFRADLYYEPINVAPGRMVTRTTRLFAGAKESAVLDQYQAQGVANFGLAIDWGWFQILVWPIWQVLIFLFDLTGNFGIAIICLTILIRGLMFPIAQKQFKSMAQLRVVQPKMKALQDRYKDDKAQLQQEMAKLYKDEGVNPLAGCLPIFLQIPIFFALYKSLLVAIEMRNEPFALWIRDLSAPDPAHIFALFDIAPVSYLAIGPMAVLLGLTMWLQFKLNPAATDPMQQQIFSIMPWILMFVMASFDSGLLLYWITSNLLTLAQQKYLYSKHPQLKAQADKEAEDKARAEQAKT